MNSLITRFATLRTLGTRLPQRTFFTAYRVLPARSGSLRLFTTQQ